MRDWIKFEKIVFFIGEIFKEGDFVPDDHSEDQFIVNLRIAFWIPHFVQRMATYSVTRTAVTSLCEDVLFLQMVPSYHITIENSQ